MELTSITTNNLVDDHAIVFPELYGYLLSTMLRSDNEYFKYRRKHYD
jgi:hypothetical protein